MKRNDIRCTTTVVAFTIAILIVFHIQDNEAVSNTWNIFANKLITNNFFYLY